MNEGKISGVIHKMLDEQQVTDKFVKREIVIETEDSYPQMILMQFVQKNVYLLNNFKEGDRVIVEYSLKGKAWKDKFFTNVEAFDIVMSSSSETPF
jgi:single-strand DNA-binding protein